MTRSLSSNCLLYTSRCVEETAPTITTILARRYIAKENRNLYVTELGEVVNNMMKEEMCIRDRSVDTRDIKNEKTIIIFNISDFTDTMTIKMFVRTEQVKDCLLYTSMNLSDRIRKEMPSLCWT